MQDLVIGFFAGVAAVISGFFAVRKFLGWLRPVTIYPTSSYRRGEPDRLEAMLVNRSREPVYVMECRARGAYPLRKGVRAHLRHPFARPSRLKSLYFEVNTYEMLSGDAVRLEPAEPKVLQRNMMFKNPASAVPTPMLIIEVVLSSGKTVRSRRFNTPVGWTIQWHLSQLVAGSENA